MESPLPLPRSPAPLLEVSGLSTGYGDDFKWATWGGWGNKDGEDVMSGVDYLVARYPIDRDRVGVIYGENSYLFSQDVADYMFKVLDESVPFVAIPDAQHHVFLDQPLAFVASLRTLLAEWRHSKPQREIPITV